MIRKILGLVVLILAMTAALVAYSMTNEVPDVSGTMTSYKQKIVAQTRQIAEPILQKAGIDVEKANIEDANVIQNQVEDASKKLNETTKTLTQ